MIESTIIPAAPGFYHLRAALCDDKISVAFDCAPVIAWKLGAHESEPVLMGQSNYDSWRESEDTISMATQAPNGCVYDLNEVEFESRAVWEKGTEEYQARRRPHETK